MSHVSLSLSLSLSVREREREKEYNIYIYVQSHTLSPSHRHTHKHKHRSGYHKSHTQTHTHTHMHEHTHTHTHTHAHTQERLPQTRARDLFARMLRNLVVAHRPPDATNSCNVYNIYTSIYVFMYVYIYIHTHVYRCIHVLYMYVFAAIPETTIKDETNEFYDKEFKEEYERSIETQNNSLPLLPKRSMSYLCIIVIISKKGLV
jgi:hypothetical protein